MLSDCRRLQFLLIVLTISLLTFGFQSAARAEIVEIPLVEVVSADPIVGSWELETTFPFNLHPDYVTSVSLRVAGTVEVGTFNCDGVVDPWPLEFGVFLRDTSTGGWWSAWGPGPPTSGTFNFIRELEPSFSMPPTWDFLANEIIAITFMAMTPTSVGLCDELIIVDPVATITEAVLVFDMLQVVAVENTHWGTLKALYR